MNTCQNCQTKFSLEDGGFIWDGLVFCELCDPEEKKPTAMMQILGKHYAHEVVIACDTKLTEAGEPEKDAAYWLECLECDEKFIPEFTSERQYQ
jgi:hypothetical protein